MLILFSRLPQNPNFPIPLSIRTLMSSPAAAKVVAEYAKSNRSSCKICDKPIASGSLRLGLSTKDPRRGFDLVKWHHLDCFPSDSRPLSAAKEIKGFSDLKGSDQEVLRNLEAAASNDECSPQDLKRDCTEIEEPKRSVKKAKALDEDDDDGSICCFPGVPRRARQRERGNENTTIQQTQSTQDVRGSAILPTSTAATKASGAGELEISFSVADVKNVYKDAALEPNWKSFKTIIFREAEDGLHDSEKIAAFDFDGCLANTSVKRSGPDAWSLMYPSIPEKLQELYNSGYKLVIFTNESNIERWKTKRQKAVDSKIGRLNGFLKRVKVPMQVFIACGLGKNKDQIDDPFRKPKPGMWKIMTENFNSGIAVDMDQSFYVGDAAGRVNDHSDADIRFAQAIGLKFYLPEEFFGA